jgi:hypothetical protein
MPAKLIITVFAGMAEFERDLIREVRLLLSVGCAQPPTQAHGLILVALAPEPQVFLGAADVILGSGEAPLPSLLVTLGPKQAMRPRAQNQVGRAFT